MFMMAYYDPARQNNEFGNLFFDFTDLNVGVISAQSLIKSDHLMAQYPSSKL